MFTPYTLLPHLSQLQRLLNSTCKSVSWAATTVRFRSQSGISGGVIFSYAFLTTTTYCGEVSRRVFPFVSVAPLLNESR